MIVRCAPLLVVSSLGITLAACGSGSAESTSTSATGSGGSGGSSPASTTSVGTGTGGSSGAGGSGGSAAAPICMEPIQAVDTSVATTKVGSGKGTCTEQAF